MHKHLTKQQIVASHLSGREQKELEVRHKVDLALDGALKQISFPFDKHPAGKMPADFFNWLGLALSIRPRFHTASNWSESRQLIDKYLDNGSTPLSVYEVQSAVNLIKSLSPKEFSPNCDTLSEVLIAYVAIMDEVYTLEVIHFAISEQVRQKIESDFAAKSQIVSLHGQ